MGESYIHGTPGIDSGMIDRIESAFADTGYRVMDYPLYGDSIADSIGARISVPNGMPLDLNSSDFGLSGNPNGLDVFLSVSINQNAFP